MAATGPAPEVTVFPVAELPACIAGCGLYDVNGACAPPQLPREQTDSCFCNDARLTKFRDGTAGVCDAVCQPADLTKIRDWYTNFCAKVQPAAQETGTASTSTSTGKAAQQNNGGGHQTWIEGHYQWVIFLVVMVVAIVGIWVGACIWRRRYLRKRDRQYALGTNLAHATESGRVVPNASNGGSIHVPGAGMFEPAPLSSAAVYNEKKHKKKWVVKERT
ncbi:hypothetical protein QBC35DRAFT_100165 [Podospora australis]|uniref:Integral membrane protein n=1 Tax=Podospora australis TaxID=1536484 RepID=A0AAN6X4J4_9PEZI|nr:hypothetical protein QBC35DRAFT_100165 [Podospora australis]